MKDVALQLPRPQAAWAAAALVAAALAGCGKREEAAPPVAQAPAAASAAASAPAALKAAFVYIGPVGKSGWTYAHDLGRQAVEKEFGDKVKTTLVADVPESAVSNWGPCYIKTVRDVMDGKWTVGHSWWGVKEGANDIVSISDKVPADRKAKVEEARQGLADGSVSVCKGPLVDNAGVVRLPADKVADDEFIEKIRFYVRGVEGRVPGDSKS